jgi:CHAT domain-containing protein/tetratricopeptide (TPR) repeat protein
MSRVLWGRTVRRARRLLPGFVVVSLGLSMLAWSERARAAEAAAAPPPAASAASPTTPEAIRALFPRGQFDLADSLARARLDELGRARGTDSVAVANMVDVLVESMWRRRGRLPADAEAQARRLVRLREQTAGPEKLEVAAALTQLGRVQRALRKLDDAQASYERALAIRRKLLPPDHEEIAVSLTSLGLLMRDRGQLEQSRDLLEQALEIRERRFGPGHIEVAKALNNLSITLDRMTQFGASSAALARAVRIAETRSPVDSVLLASLVGSYSSSLLHLGDPGAGAACERVIDIYTKMGLTDDRAWGDICENYGVCLVNQKEYDRARAMFERSSRSLNKVYAPGDLPLARNLWNSARLDMATMHFDSAAAKLDRAADWFGAMGEGFRLHQAGALGFRGMVEVDRGRWQPARPFFERSYDIRRAALSPDSREVAIGLHDVAWCRFVAGDTVGTLDLVLAGERGVQSNLRLSAEALSEREALSYANIRPDTYGQMLSILEQGQGRHRVPDVWDCVMRARGTVFEAIASRERWLHAEGDSTLAALAEQHGAAARELAAFVSAGASSDDIAAARLRKESIERDIGARGSGAVHDARRDTAGFAEVAKALHPDEALVAYVRFDRLDPQRIRDALSRAAREKKDGLKASSGSTRPWYAAFVMRGGARPSFVDIGPAATVDSLVERWRVRAAASKAGASTAGDALRKCVWDPVAGAVRDAKLAFVVPDGAIDLVNLAALPSGTKAFVLETGPTLHYLASGRDLVLRDTKAPAARELLAMGAIDYDHVASVNSIALAPPVGASTVSASHVATHRSALSDCADFESAHADSLPWSGPEVRQIEALWNTGMERTASAADTSHALCLTGAQASEAAFKQLAPRRGVIHVATHGFFLSDACDSHPSSSAEVGVWPSPREILDESPLLRSGLLLAGSNGRAKHARDAEDGVLTAEEIATLDLSSASWVVLSACNTGLGTVRAGEGVSGLRSAFKYAGAHTVIMSLWKVNDAATRRWMELLYQGRFVQGLSTAEAVRKASKTLLSEQRARGGAADPASWGAFIASGDWR